MRIRKRKEKEVVVIPEQVPPPSTCQNYGWVNIYKHGKGYYTGGDIHPTIEGARKVCRGHKAMQIFIEFDFEEDNG